MCKEGEKGYFKSPLVNLQRKLLLLFMQLSYSLFISSFYCYNSDVWEMLGEETWYHTETFRLNEAHLGFLFLITPPHINSAVAHG